jgi:hypothetical protein
MKQRGAIFFTGLGRGEGKAGLFSAVWGCSVRLVASYDDKEIIKALIASLIAITMFTMFTLDLDLEVYTLATQRGSFDNVIANGLI